MAWVLEANMQAMFYLSKKCRAGFVGIVANGDNVVPLLVNVLVDHFGVWWLMSIPTSLITLMALGFTCVAGLVPNGTVILNAVTLLNGNAYLFWLKKAEDFAPCLLKNVFNTI